MRKRDRIVGGGLDVQLAEAEYFGYVDPVFTHECEFGTFYSHPDFPDRHDANQLCRVRCGEGESARLIHELDRLRDLHGVETRKVSGGDRTVWEHLGPKLRRGGWQVWHESMMLFTTAPQREVRADLDIRSVPATSVHLERLYTHDGELGRGFVFSRSQFERVGGEYLVGFASGEPVCCTGWYQAAGFVRFRHVFTTPSARGRGFASTLIRYVQDHPAVRAVQGLVIMVDDEGPKRLYQELGFRETAKFWAARS